jgi:PRD1 phage membrane DNA delivery
MALAAEHDFWGTISAIGLGIIGVGALAAVVSKNSNTVGVIQSSGNAFSQGLGTALSPVTGTSASYGFGGASPFAASGSAIGGAGLTFPIG